MEYQIVIPARAGSKRLHRKNLINFCGKPLISHTIEFAINSFPRDKIWVNTDDQEIKIIAQEYGVQITDRPNSLGTDNTSTADVLSFQCNDFLNSSISCDAIILLQATNPLRPAKIIEERRKQKEEKVAKEPLVKRSPAPQRKPQLDQDPFSAAQQ